MLQSKLPNYLITAVYLFATMIPHSSFAQELQKMDMSAEARISHHQKSIRSLKAQIADEQYEFSKLIDAKNYDIKAIKRFVKESIQFQPYRGILKGPTGVLLTRSGNSADQSALLAKLLKDSGQDARVVRGKLEKEAAMILAKSFSSYIPEFPTPFKNEAALQQALRDWLAPYGLYDPAMPLSTKSLYEPQLEKNQQSEQVPSIAKNLLEKTESEKPEFKKKDDVTDSFTKELQDYFWVQTRLSSAQEWQDIHPVFSSAIPEKFKQPEINEIYAERLPSELYHSIELDLTLTQLRSDKEVSSKIMETISLPVANALLEPQQIAFFSDTFLARAAASKNGQEISPEEEKQPTMYFPVYNNSFPAGARAFDNNGQTFAPEDGLNRAAKVFKTVSDKGLLATKALSSVMDAKDKDKEQLLSIQKITLTYRFVRPGQETVVAERDLYHEGTEQQLQDALNREWILLPSAGPIVPSAWLSRALDQVEDFTPIVKVAALKRENPEREVPISEDDLKNVRTDWLGHYTLYDIFEKNLYLDNPLRYRPGAALVAVSRPLFHGTRSTVTIDIVDSPWRVLEQEGKKWLLDKQAVILQGVWESYVEGTGTQSSVSSQSAFKQLSRSSLGGHLQTVASSDIEKYPQYVSLNMKRAQRDGQLLFSPLKDLTQQERIAWWEVDPATGVARAVFDTGIGGDTEEYIVNLVFGGVSLIMGLSLGYAAMSSCKAKYGKDATCCYMDAAAYGVGSLALGGIMTYLFSAAISLTMVGLHLNPVLQVGRIVDLAPSFCH